MRKELFGLNKDGSFKVWVIEVVDHAPHQAMIRILSGKDGGKLTEKLEYVTEGKQGRDVWEQAVFQANARIKKNEDKGYRETKEELTDLPLLAMLSKDALKDGHQIPYEEGVLLSDKLDGVRCLAKCVALGVVEIESRTGQPYNVPHIQKALAWVMNPGETLDGELYVHGPSLQEITSAVKREDAHEKVEKLYLKMGKLGNSKGYDSPEFIKAREDHAAAVEILAIRNQLEFRAFDFLADKASVTKPFQTRLNELNQFFVEREVAACIVKVAYITVFSEDKMKAEHKYAVERGYEGIMIRTLDGLYESGKRSSGLYKFKAFMDAEFLILDIIPDKSDGSKFVVQNDIIDNQFRPVMGSMVEREHYLAEKHLYIGKYLKVKFQARYKGTLLPQFPTGVMIREGSVIDGQFVPSE